MKANSAPQKKTTSLRTRVWQRVVLALFVSSARYMQRLPREKALRFGRKLGRIACRTDKRRRRIADSNLRLAYGDSLSATEREILVRRVFEHWGASTVEFLRGPSYDRPAMDRLVTAVEGREYLEAVREAGNGFVVVSGHIGNFEFLGRWMAGQGVPSTAIVRDPADPAFAAYMRKIREFGGNVMLPRGTQVRELLLVLKRKEVLTLAADQNSGDLFLPFFGTPAGTPAGPATLARRTGVPMLPAFCVLEPDDSYRMIFLPPVLPESGGNRETDVLAMTSGITGALEEVVRRYPSQWLWLHNRWKSAFEEDSRKRWPDGYDFDAAWECWKGDRNIERPRSRPAQKPAESPVKTPDSNT